MFTNRKNHGSKPKNENEKVKRGRENNHESRRIIGLSFLLAIFSFSFAYFLKKHPLINSRNISQLLCK